MTADVVSAYVGNNVLPPDQLADVIGAVHSTLSNLERDGG
ncbi:MAG: MucR family transcriptional regulator, partial [Alphaproteobacteria bacterium]|nr:MucR family transcriptional regulator [Alphaproteobacteria bacterium]